MNRYLVKYEIKDSFNSQYVNAESYSILNEMLSFTVYNPDSSGISRYKQVSLFNWDKVISVTLDRENIEKDE